MRSSASILAVMTLAGAFASAQQSTITFTPTAGVPTFAVRDPVLRVKPGTTVETKTFSQPGDYYEGRRVARRSRAVPHRRRGPRGHAGRPHPAAPAEPRHGGLAL
jgi:hypothetical protein